MLKDLGKRENIKLFIDFYYPTQVKDNKGQYQEQEWQFQNQNQAMLFFLSLLEPETKHHPGVLLDFHGQWAQEIYWIVIFKKDQSIQIADTGEAGSLSIRETKTLV